MAGVLIGGLLGAIGFCALIQFVKSVTDGGKIKVLWALVFFLLPPAALVGVAFAEKDLILPAGIAMTAVLVCAAVVYFVSRKIGNKKDTERDESKTK